MAKRDSGFAPLLLAAILAASTTHCSSPPTQFTGRLEPELSPSENPLAYVQENLRPMPVEERVRWEVPARMGDPVFQAELRLAGGILLPIVVIDAPRSPLKAYVDGDADKSFAGSELLLFGPSSHPGFEQETLFLLPLPDAPYSHFPIRIRFFKHSVRRGEQTLTARAVSWNRYAAQEGRVEIGGEQLRLVFEGLLPERLSIDPRSAILAIDSDGNGEIDFSPLSPEWVMARQETVVMRAGNHYVSFSDIDPGRGLLRLKNHPPSDYRRIELKRGDRIPEFTFVDFEGNSRKLSEFRGSWVLLDFWGSWCGPCIAEFPNLVETHSEFHDRGFEILGMNSDPAPQDLRRGVGAGELNKGLEAARAAVRRFGADWPQARTESIMELVLERFRIYAYPTSILLDPEGRVFSGNEPERPLRGPGLRETLSKVLD